MICLALLLLARWLAPKLPAPLIVVVLAIIASAALGLAGYGVAVVGEIPAGLPSLPLPDLRLRAILDLAPAAIGIFFVSFSDEILVARSFAGRHGQHIRPAAELAAMGAASLAASVSQGMPVGASGSRTAVNDQMRGRTQVSGLLAAGVVALVLLFLTAPMQYLPKATLGAVIIAASIGLIEPAAWRGLARVSKVEVVIAAITMIGVIVVGVLPALLLAIALAVIDVIRRSATPHDAVLGWVERLGRHADVRMHPSAQVTPGVLIYRLDDRLFFANATYVQARIREADRGRTHPRPLVRVRRRRTRPRRRHRNRRIDRADRITPEAVDHLRVRQAQGPDSRPSQKRRTFSTSSARNTSTRPCTQPSPPRQQTLTTSP